MALTAAGLGHRMPRDWNGVDVLARYTAAGIEIGENTDPTARGGDLENGESMTGA